MVRGFVTGVAWGGVVAGLGLAVISQVAPRPQSPVEVVATSVPEAVREAPIVPVAPEPAPLEPTSPETAPLPAPEAPSAPNAPPVPELPETAPDAVTAPSAAPPAAPDVTAVQDPPIPPDSEGHDPLPIPGASALVEPAPGAVPEAVAPPDPVAAADQAPVIASDLPPPISEQEALLVPAPAPVADPAPALIAPDVAPAADVPLAPGAAAPLPDPAPDLPIATPLPVPEPEIVFVSPDAPTVEKPAPGLEPVKPIIAADTPRTLAPDPGLPLTDGAKAARLPRIGGEAEEAAGAELADAPPLQRFARQFENPDGKPLFSILLRDTGEANLDRAALARISFPVSFVLDPMEPGAAEAAKVYRKGGQEVLMLASGIPEGATPGDLEQTFESLAGVLPETVAVIDQATGGFQGNRPMAKQVISILAAQGRGLVTFDAGLNAADQEARRAALPAAMIFRRLDAEGEPTPTVRRYLDRAAFKAAQEGRVVVLGDTRPETVAALLEWAVEGRAASVALAPVSAVMQAP